MISTIDFHRRIRRFPKNSGPLLGIPTRSLVLELHFGVPICGNTVLAVSAAVRRALESFDKHMGFVLACGHGIAALAEGDSRHVQQYVQIVLLMCWDSWFRVISWGFHVAFLG